MWTGDSVILQMKTPISEFIGANEFIPFYTFSGAGQPTGLGVYSNLVYLTSPIGTQRAVVSGQNSLNRFWLSATTAAN